MPDPKQIAEAIAQHEAKYHRKKLKFVPPTIEEVQAYIDKNGYNVNAAEFIKYYAEGVPPWHDQQGKPVRGWKQKLIAVWAKMPKAKRCSTYNCRKMGIWVGTDDTRAEYWKCEDHKPKRKPLPADIPIPNMKAVPDPKADFNAARNKQKRALGVSK